MVSKPIDGKPASHANGGTIGFMMSSPEQVQAWHKAGVANGGSVDRGPARGAPRGRRPDVSRLSSRSRWQQAVARFIACQPELSRIKTTEGRPFGRPFSLVSLPLRSAVFQPIAEPNRAVLQHLAAHQRHGAERCARVGLIVVGVEDVRPPRAPSTAGQTARLSVDETGPQELPVRLAAGRSQKLDGNYWRRHARQPVEFAKSVHTLCRSELQGAAGDRAATGAHRRGPAGMARPGHRTAGDRVVASKHRRPPPDHRSPCRRVRRWPPAPLRRCAAGAGTQARPAHLSVPASPVLVPGKCESGPPSIRHTQVCVPKPSGFSKTAGSRNSPRYSAVRATINRPLNVLTKLAAQHNQHRKLSPSPTPATRFAGRKPRGRLAMREPVRRLPGCSSADDADAVQPLVDALTAQGHQHRDSRVACVRRGRARARRRVARRGEETNRRYGSCTSRLWRPTPCHRRGRCRGCNTECWAEHGDSSAPRQPLNCVRRSGW